jgi:hypothetical protein
MKLPPLPTCNYGRDTFSASLRIVSLDEAEHFSHNQKASVATLR